MKSESDINEKISILKDALVQAESGGVLLLQGFIRALQWTLSDEQDRDAFSEDDS